MTKQRTIDIEGNTVKEAISDGLNFLGVSRDCVKIQILTEENKGLFGMVGAKRALVRLTIIEKE